MHLPGSWQRWARSAWVLCAILALGVFLLSIAAQSSAAPGYLLGSVGVPESSPWVGAFNIINALAHSSAALLSLVLAGLLFFKQTDESMALFLAYFLLAYGVIVAGPLANLEPLWPGMSDIAMSVIQPILFAPLLVTFLSIFPNGRFVPSWTRWLVVVSWLYGPVSVVPLYILSDFTALSSLGVLLWFALIFTGLYAQIYRYRHVATLTHRQQTKWVLFGFSLLILFVSFSTVISFKFQDLPPETRLPEWASIAGLGWPLAIAALPFSLTIAVMRYRLYDVDLVINRTLVYGTLTGSVIVLYALIVGTVATLFQSAGNLMVALLATGLVAVLFQPIRARFQRGVNRLMYGERGEPFTVLRRLGQRLEGSGTPEDVLPAIVETVAQALKLPYAEITLYRGEEVEQAATYGDPAPRSVSFPIVYQDQTIGYLNVAPRRPRETLDKLDTGLLRQIARQAGPVAYAVQLTQDLRQSRTRLVTAREEERRRLRRDLHDGLGPVLASQGLIIAAVKHLLETDPAAARRFLDELAEQNEATVAEIRRLVYALRPPELDELGLVGAIREHGNGLKENAEEEGRLQVDVQTPSGKLPGLPAAVEVAAYRIATEALTNVTRHARARRCTVSISLEDHHRYKVLKLKVADDGVGFPENCRAGVGLNSMRERAEEAGGTFKIESGAQKGTSVVARFPLET